MLLAAPLNSSCIVQNAEATAGFEYNICSQALFQEQHLFPPAAAGAGQLSRICAVPPCVVICVITLLFTPDPDCPALPCRYRLAKEQPNRPAGEALDYIIMQALDPQAAAVAAGEKPPQRGLLESVGATMASMQRFMKSLSQ